MTLPNRFAIAALSALLAVSLFGSASAQSGTKSKPLTAEQFRAAFWKYLTSGQSDYKKWGSLPGHDEGIEEGGAPHGAFVQIFANSIARRDPKALAHGSIIVKENYGEDKKTLMAVTVMYRTKGFDAAHRDWYWIKFLPDGKVARTPEDKGSKPIAGKFKSCIACHDGADGKDFTFSND